MHDPLIVAHITGLLSSRAGGLATAIPELAAGLATIGEMQVHIVGARDPDSPEVSQRWGPNASAHRMLGLPAFQWAPGMLRALETVSPAIVHTHGLWTFPSLASLKYHRRHHKPYVITPHGMLDPWAMQRSRWKKRLASAWFENNHLHMATCLHATAEMEAQHFRSFGLRQPIAVIPNGINIPQSTRPTQGPRTAAKARRILFLSRIHPKKGLPFLLRAWSSIAAANPDWHLVLAGPDEIGHEAELRRLAATLNAPRVEWTGAVHGSEKAELYASADLLVLPTHAENFGLVVAEALAHGVPVITTRNAPWSGLERHRCGWWIELTDAALREALERAIALPDEERQAMGLRGRAWMQRDFGWDRIARDMHQVYQWLAHGGKVPAAVWRD